MYFYNYVYHFLLCVYIYICLSKLEELECGMEN